MDKKPNWKIHSDIHSALRARHQLSPLLNKNSPISTEDKLRLFPSIICTILFYAAPITFNSPAVYLRQYKSFYKKSIRFITSTNNLIPFKEIAKAHSLKNFFVQPCKQITKFHLKLKQINNKLINSLGQPLSKKRKKFITKLRSPLDIINTLKSIY